MHYTQVYAKDLHDRVSGFKWILQHLYQNMPKFTNAGRGNGNSNRETLCNGDKVFYLQQNLSEQHSQEQEKWENSSKRLEEVKTLRIMSEVGK